MDKQKLVMVLLRVIGLPLPIEALKNE